MIKFKKKKSNEMSLFHFKIEKIFYVISKMCDKDAFFFFFFFTLIISQVYPYMFKHHNFEGIHSHSEL
jgi:hypothetical protein